MQTVRTSSGLCHKVGPFPGKREGDPARHACLYADYPSVDNPSDDELAANARLIAAAPDLLDHCIKALAAWEGTGPAILLDDLRAVIAKATGAA